MRTGDQINVVEALLSGVKLVKLYDTDPKIESAVNLCIQQGGALLKHLEERNRITVEDFHIGFEYEEYVASSDRYFVGKDRYSWVRKVYGFNSPWLHKMDQLIKEGKVRNYEW